MEQFRKAVVEAASFIESQIEPRPEIGIVLGTGLGGIVDSMDRSFTAPYDSIPNFPVSTVESHRGRLVFGNWAGKPVMVMQGRFHLYEGYTSRQISFPIRVMQALGVRALIVSGAAGGLDPRFESGDLMLIADHINFTGHNPLVGPNVDEWGARFTDMTEPYSLRLRKIARATALSERILLHTGVYAGVLGPSLETAAETRFLRLAGADAVGMSITMEAITANHAGMEVLGFCAITNVNLPDCYKPSPIAEIIATAEKSGAVLTRLMEKILPQI